LLDFVANQRQADGGWADPDQPADVLTTLAAADLLSGLDPTFDPAPTIAFFEHQQEASGWWRALNPEVPWLTGAIADWLTRADKPFPERFRWPDLPVWARDRTTGLPARAVLDELCVALAGIPGLADAPLEAAFIDLADFGEINNDYGQDAGDMVLAEYAAALTRLPGTLTIRIGGDELLVVGKPHTAGSLEPLLHGFMADWVEAAATAVVPRTKVLPRIVITADRAARLRNVVGRLGTEIAKVKKAHLHPQPPGVLVWAPGGPS
jgi:diguanylate cyclase (GGDEF)-like protein